MVDPVTLALGAGSVISGIGGAILGSSAVEKANKTARRDAASAARDNRFAARLDPSTISLPGGAGATFQPSQVGQQLTQTGQWINGNPISVDGAGNLFVIGQEKGSANQGQPFPLNQQVQLGPNGEIPDIPGAVVGNPKFQAVNPSGQLVPQEVRQAAAAGPQAGVTLGDLEPGRAAFAGGIAPQAQFGSQILDPTIDPNLALSQGFGQAGGFAPGQGGPGGDPFAQLAGAQQFADVAGAQIPQTAGALQGFLGQGADVGAVGAGQFAGGFDPRRAPAFTEAALGATQAAGQGFDAAAADRLSLLREQAAPAQQRLLQSIEQSAFNRGQLGSAGGREALRSFGEQVGQQDLGFQLASQDLGRQLQSDATSRAATFGGLATGEQATGLAGFGGGTGAGFGATSGLADLSNILAQRGQARFGRAADTFGQIQGAQQQAFQQGVTDREQFLNQLRGNITGSQAEREAAFSRALQGSNAALAFGQEARNLAQLPVNLAATEANIRLGGQSNITPIQAAQIQGITPNTGFADAFAGLSTGLGTLAGDRLRRE